MTPAGMWAFRKGNRELRRNGTSSAKGAARRVQVIAALTRMTPIRYAALGSGTTTGRLPQLEDIIDELRRDARLANTELAHRVRLTPAPCLRRVKRLEGEGVITGYHARMDPTAAGRPFEVTVSVEMAVNDQRSVEDFESSVAQLTEVVEARRVFGRSDYILRVLVADVAAYERFQTTKLLRLPGVSRTVSHQTMKLIKQEL